MNKPSDVFDFLDKSAEWYNFFIDINTQEIVKEINWLNMNYNNIHELRVYFLRFVNHSNFDYYMKFFDYLNSLSDEEIQIAVQHRANILYNHIKYNKQQKIENKPLKLIAEELKRYNQ